MSVHTGGKKNEKWMNVFDYEAIKSKLILTE